MADYYVDENGKITKKKKKKTSAYSVDLDGNITTHKDEDLAPIKSTGATSIGTLSSEEGEELLSKLPLTARLYHERSGGFVDTSKSWNTKVDEATKLILSGGDPDYAETDKLLKQLKTQHKYIEIGDPTGEGMAEYQGYYNTLIIAKNRDILSKTKMDGTNHSVLEEMQLLSGLSGDEKEKRKNAVLKKMDELGVPSKDYALFTDDSNFNWGDFGKWVEHSVGAGFSSFNKGMMATADLILGKRLQALGWENNPISLANRYTGEVYDQQKQAQQLYAERLGGGSGWQFAGDAVEGTIGAVPNALMAIMSYGASSGTTSTDLARKAAYEVGNVLQKAGLTVSSMMKNPQYWLSFARTYGTDYEEAKERGVSDSVAVLGATITSLVNAGIEIGPDGGSGFQGLPDDLLSGNKNKAWAWLKSSFEEGNEEGLQKFVGELVTKTMYDHDADILNPSEYAREMGIGTLSGAALGGGQIAVGTGVKAYKQYQANKLTADEQVVLEKVVEEVIAEKEKDGSKLTASEKRDVKKQIRKQLEQGGINIEKIEEILGGEAYEAFHGEMKKFFESEAYKAHQKNTEAENAIRDEYNELGKKGAANLAETARFNDLHQQMKDIRENAKALKEKLSPEVTRLVQMRDAMRKEVATRVKDSRLAESYREFARSKEAFTPDMSKYTDENARKTVQNIVDSGFGNNSKAFQNTVDFLARLSADRGRAFTLTNNENLKGTKHYKEGRVTNGFVDENGDIVLNVDSARALETTTGHEITHVLKAAGAYSELSQAVRDYCISKEGLERYNARIKEAEEIYKGREGTTPEAEVVADLIGEYVFSDADFVKNLSTSNRGLFERIYDEIKYLAKIATAGSKEARELERVKKLFAEAYRENVKGQKNTAEDGGVRYSYSRPNFTKDEWAIVNRRKHSEFDNPKYDLDENSKWMYAKEKGYTVFAVYSKHDVDDPTVLYGSSGQNAATDYETLNAYFRGELNVERSRTKPNRRTLNAILADINSAKRNEIAGLPSASGRESATGNVQFPFAESRSNSGRNLEDGSGNIWEEELTEYNEEASGEPGASFITFSNDYAAIRNYMKDHDNATDEVAAEDSEDMIAPVRHSISKEGAEPKQSGLTYWEDIMPRHDPLAEFEAPVREDVMSAAENVEVSAPDVAEQNENDSLGENRIINTLTGEEIDGNTYNILSRLDNGDAVTAEELANLKEVREGKLKMDELVQDFIAKNPAFKDIPLDDVGTYLLNNDERNQLKRQIINERLEEGSFSHLDEKGKEVYTGSVKYGKRLDIVIGLPASGKSSSIVNPLSQFYQSVVIDSDIIKARLPEFNDGWGASLVHEESSIINLQLLEETMNSGKNVVLPIVGSKIKSVEDYIAIAKRLGYDINIHLNELPNGKAVGRMLKRYFDEGRFIDPAYTAGCGNKPTEVYEQIKQRGDISGYSKWNNDVPKGQRPSQSEISENNQVYGQYSSAWRASRGQVSGRLAEATEQAGQVDNEIAPIKQTSSKDGVFFDDIAPSKVDAIQKTVESLVEEQYPDIAPTKVVKPDDSVGAAPYGFDPVTQLQYEYGTIPDGENPVRDDSLPKSTNGKDKVSLTARTVKGAKATPDELVDLLDKETVGGRFSYIPIKNSETVQKAYNEIVKKGWEAARGEWEAKVRRGEVSAELTATGSLLLNNAAKAGDRKAWLSVLHDYQIMGTNAGQAVQAMRILKTLTPDDSLYMIERSVEQMVEDMKLGTEIVIDENLKQKYLDAKTDGERDAARKALAEDVAKQIPSTATDKWTALRYLNMLGNLRTQGRNILGNLGMSVTSGIKNTVATTIEAIAEKVSGGKFHRTKSLFVNKDLLKAARNDFVNVKSIALNGGKFNDPMAKSLQFQQEVQDARRIFKLAPLEGYRKATNWSMDTGDLVFSKAAYGRALAGYLKANGITETDFSKIDLQTLDKARAYAVEQAQETTFRDNNWLSSWVSKVGRRKDTPKGGKLISEGVMPFRKTPANILLRAEEYSPLGIVNAMVKSIQTAKGNATGADVVNSWAKALTGTGLFALGMWLNNSGALSGGPDEDDDKEWFEDQYGWQNYAIQIGDHNFTIDFLSPAAMPLLMGAQLNELRQNSGIDLKDMESALLSIADPMIEMSMLQGVNDTLDNIRYAESNMGQFVVNACVSYLTQGLTNSFLGQIERSVDGQRMSTYVDKNSDIPAWLQKALGKASAKTPGWDYQQIPYVDAWGETEDIAPVAALAENTLSPSYIEQGISDELYNELNRLNDAQSDINVYPQNPDKTVTFDDAYGIRHENYNLSAEEYVELAKLQGQTQKELVEDILSSNLYSRLTDQEKAKAVQLAYQYAREYSRQEVLGADGFSAKWMREAEDDIVNAIIAHTNEEMTFAYDYPEKYAVAKAVGGYGNYKSYSSELYDIKADKDASGKTISGSRKQKVIDYINGLDADYGQKIILYKSEYPADDTYNNEILEYVNNLNGFTYEDRVTILRELGFTVLDDGRVFWD